MSDSYARLRDKLPEIKEWVKRLSEEEVENEQSYRILEAIYEVQAGIEDEALRRLEEAGLVKEIEDAARKIATERKPLIVVLGGLPKPLMDEEFLSRSMFKIMDAAEKEGFNLGGDAASIRAPLEQSLLSLSHLVEELLAGREDSVNAWAGAVSADRDRIRALVLWLIQPLLGALRVAANGALDWARDYWQQGVCPVCGSATRVGYMRGEGRKQFLRCQVCGMEWVFPRARCPYCGAEKPGDVVFYRPIESRPWLRLYHCNRCGAYWKIVDEESASAAKEPLPPRELYDVFTYSLDIVAEKLSSERSEKR